MASKQAAKTTLSPAEVELKILHDFTKHSDKAWAKKGVAIIRAMPLLTTSDSGLAPDLEICRHNRKYARAAAVTVINDAKGAPHVRMWPPHRSSYYLKNGIAIEIERYSFSQSHIRKAVNFYPIDLVTGDVNAYAIEVGMRGDASPLGLVKDPLNAIQIARLDLASIGIAESMMLSVQDAVGFAQQTFSAKTSGAIEEPESYTMDFSEPD
ncbi:hypothetical protein GALL_393690 [mine drainage metagenome]|uniref:Uncharacterized protein n=1 Tax=mine drainage metagenome TaxID=410659 RepID=A0A1J5QSN7_9ZZZZ